MQFNLVTGSAIAGVMGLLILALAFSWTYYIILPMDYVNATGTIISIGVEELLSTAITAIFITILMIVASLVGFLLIVARG